MEELERLPICDDGRMEVCYYCDNKMCPNHELQPFYCLHCYEEDGKHEHRAMGIQRMIKSEHDAWRTLLINC
jgi:hypothetical protein